MGVLPSGTLNHFARDMEIPLDLGQAAVVAATGRTVAIDIAEVNGHFFLTNSLLGLYPFYRAEREWQEASGRPKPATLFMAFARTLWRFPRLRLRFLTSGGELKRTTPYVLIANNEHAMEGFKPWKRDSMTEGRLWVYVLRDRGRAGLLRLIAKIASGGSLAQEEFERLSAREVVIDSTWRGLRVAVDGEIVQVRAPLTYRSWPGALKVIVPAGSKRAQEAAEVRAPARQ
jgi:diacylglycerol kinase family enzyme